MRDLETIGNGVRRTLLYSALIAALSIGTSALANDVQKGNQNGIAFENGGWSIDSADAIKGRAGQFPVMLVFAWAEGSYLSDVNVQVVNGKGDRLLSLNNLGPLVLIDLPKGDYMINVERNGKPQSRRVSVASNTRTKAVFHWPKDATDRGLAIGAADSQGVTAGTR
jgi:hypothetical protein